MAGSRKIRWRVGKWTKKVDPAVDNHRRSLSRSRRRKAMRDLKSAAVMSDLKVGEEPVPAMLKGWTLASSDKRLRGKQGKASRKLGGQGKGEPPRSRRTEVEARGRG